MVKTDILERQQRIIAIALERGRGQHVKAPALVPLFVQLFDLKYMLLSHFIL